MHFLFFKDDTPLAKFDSKELDLWILFKKIVLAYLEFLPPNLESGRLKSNQDNIFLIYTYIFGHTAQHVGFLRSGVEPMPPAVKVWSLNHRPTMEVPKVFLNLTSNKSS